MQRHPSLPAPPGSIAVRAYFGLLVDQLDLEGQQRPGQVNLPILNLAEYNGVRPCPTNLAVMAVVER